MGKTVTILGAGITLRGEALLLGCRVIVDALIIMADTSMAVIRVGAIVALLGVASGGCCERHKGQESHGEHC